jgi:hypothetical protein
MPHIDLAQTEHIETRITLIFIKYKLTREFIFYFFKKRVVIESVLTTSVSSKRKKRKKKTTSVIKIVLKKLIIYKISMNAAKHQKETERRTADKELHRRCGHTTSPITVCSLLLASFSDWRAAIVATTTLYEVNTINQYIGS